jgi:hypothetical protein
VSEGGEKSGDIGRPQIEAVSKEGWSGESPDVGRPEFGVVSRVGRKSGDVGRPQIVVVLY